MTLREGVMKNFVGTDDLRCEQVPSRAVPLSCHPYPKRSRALLHLTQGAMRR